MKGLRKLSFVQMVFSQLAMFLEAQRAGNLELLRGETACS